jgi:integrase
VFASAVEDDDYGLPSNPALGVRVGRRRGEGADEPVKVLEFDALERLLDELGTDWQLFFDFLFETGLRISEAIEVRWGDLDLGRGRLTVSRQFYRGKLGKPKGQKTRTVRLSARMAQELQQQRQAAPDGQLVFTAERGGRLIPSNLMSRVLKPAAVKIGLGSGSSSAAVDAPRPGLASTPSGTPARRSCSCAAGTRSRSRFSSATPIRPSPCAPTSTCCRRTSRSPGVTTK